jgi:hypothetical protein
LGPPNKFLVNSTFSAGKVRQSDRLSEPNAYDAPPAVAALSTHLNTDIWLALRRTTSPWPVFNSDDPSATRLTLYRLGGSVSPPSNPTISAVGATDFAQPRGSLRLTESRPASFRWKMLSASTTPSPQFTSRNPARQLASTCGPVSRIPVRKQNRPSRSRILTVGESRRTTFPARIARTGHGSLTFRGRRLHLKHRLRADDRAFVGE